MSAIPAPDVPGEGNFDWTYMARQFPRAGRPGLSHEHKPAVVVGTLPNGTGVCAPCDSLTYRNRKGRLVGILSRWPEEIRFLGMVLETAGAISVWVDPARRRRGIGSVLLAEADRRWSPDWSAQHYTEGGYATITRYLSVRAGNAPLPM